MASRAPNSGITLTEQDASIVKGMLNRGDRQHDIAACFGVNGGRIAEIATGDKFGWVKAAPPEVLPPPGPYPRPYELVEKMQSLQRRLSEMEGGNAGQMK